MKYGHEVHKPRLICLNESAIKKAKEIAFACGAINNYGKPNVSKGVQVALTAFDLNSYDVAKISKDRVKMCHKTIDQTKRRL